MAVVANQAVAFDKSMLMACPHLGDVLRPGLILTGNPEVRVEKPTIHPWANGPGHQWSCFPEGPSPMPFAKIEQ
jgi:hypothetical protein